MIVDELYTLRRRGSWILVIGAWILTGCLAATATVFRPQDFWPVLMLAVVVNIAPSWAILRQRHDATTRMMVGTLAAFYPALGVYLLQGHPWQMDGHMYFFVTLAALTLLCDWKPIVLASAIIALHHLMLEHLEPTWVFSSSGNVVRVLVHAIAVTLQCAVLSYLAIQLRRSMMRQHEARLASDEQAAQAIEGRKAIEIAMAAARTAEHGETIERQNGKPLSGMPSTCDARKCCNLPKLFKCLSPISWSLSAVHRPTSKGQRAL